MSKRKVAKGATWKKAIARTNDSDGMPHELSAEWIWKALRATVAAAEAESPGGAPILDVAVYLKGVAHAVVSLVDARNRFRAAKGLPPDRPEVLG